MHSNPGPELLQALAALQQTICRTGQSGFNSFKNYKYSTFGDVLLAIRQAEDLCVFQILYSLPKEDGNLATGLRTVLAHPATGQMLVSEIMLPEPDTLERCKDGDTNEVWTQTRKNWEQDWGSTLTYYKKYALLSIAGLANEDDDAQKGRGRNQPKVQSKGR